MLLTTSPESANTNTVIKLAEAALAKGVDVKIFIMCDGVYNIHNILFLQLADKGAKICLCSQNLNERFQDETDDVEMGSQYDFAQHVGEVDKLLAFC